MGEVYRARDTRLKRDVALKVLPEAFATDAERLARFHREAEVLATLNHPQIAAIYGIEETDTFLALVLELVEGDTIADRIANGAIPADEAIAIATQIAQALEAAHEQGIIHRDLKPANVKVTPDGTVKVLDFGLAKLIDPSVVVGPIQPPQTSSPTITSPALMTHVGVLLGTAAYMSPEQAKGRPADKRSDVWALGCVLYEMLTARRPFDGEDISDTLASVLRSEPDWSALPADLPPAIVVLMRRCLVKDRRRRIADASVAHFVLSEERSLSPRETAPRLTAPLAIRPSIWRRALPVVSGSLVTAIGVMGIAWFAAPSRPATVITRFSVPLAERQAFTGTGRQAIAISPDGTRVVFGASGRLYLRRMDSLESQVIAGTDLGNTNPVFSPDGQSVAFWSQTDSTLRRLSVSGGAAAALTEINNPFGMSWSPGAIFVGQGYKGILRVNENGGAATQIVQVADGELAYGPQLLPDGDTLLFTVAKGTAQDRWENAQIVAQSVTSRKRTIIVSPGSDARYLSTGHVVYALAGSIHAAPFDLRTLKLKSRAVPVLVGVRRSPGGTTAAAQFTVSDTGSLVYIPGPATSVLALRTVVIAGRTSGTTPLALPPAQYTHPRVSSDGTRMVFSRNDAGGSDIWRYELAGTNAPQRLTFDGHSRFPIWAGDSNRVFFQSDRDGARGIYLLSVDGSRSTERITTTQDAESHMPESFSAVGGRLLYSVARNSTWSLWMMTMTDHKAEPFSHVQTRDPVGAVFSPDGRWLAYALNDTGGGGNSPNRGVYVEPVPATGRKYQLPRTALDFHPSWSPDGRELFYVPASLRRVVAVPFRAQPVVTFGDPVELPNGPLPSFLSFETRGYDVLPDGRFVSLMAAPEQTSTGAAIAPELRVVLNWFDELKRIVPTR